MNYKPTASTYSNITIALVVFFCIALSAQFILPPLNGEESKELTTGWTYTTKSVKEPLPIVLPTSDIINPSAGNVVLYHTLPDKFFMGATLLFRTSQQNIRLYIDDEMLYSFGDGVRPPIGDSFGSSWHFVRLPSDFMGKQLSIELYSSYEDYSCIANSVYIGTKGSHIFKILQENIISALIGVILASFGLIMVMVYYSLYRLTGKSKLILYLSMLSFLSGIWILSECRLIQFIINAPLSLYTVSMLSIFLIPLPLLYFLKSNYVFENHISLRILIFIHRFFVITAIILHMLHLVDFLITIKIFHALLLVEIGFTLYHCIKNWRKKVSKTITVGISILTVTLIINGSYYYYNPALDVTTYSKYGLVLFILIIGFNAGKHVLSQSRSSAMNNALSLLAYTDKMTGLKNRASFQEKLDYYEKNIENLDKVVIAMADLNYLKCINDSLGHKKGDDLIIQCGDILARHFGKIGSVYRIGGDEFAVIMPEASVAQCNEALNAIKRSVKLYNKTNPTSGVLSIAIGIEHFNLAYDKTINDLLSRADAAMYTNKIAQKERKNYTTQEMYELTATDKTIKSEAESEAIAKTTQPDN